MKFLLLIILFSTSAFGKIPDLSITDAIRIGIQNSPIIKNLQADNKLAKLEYEIKRINLFFPQVSISGGTESFRELGNAQGFATGNKVQDINKGQSSFGNVGITISDINLYNGGRDKNELEIARLELKDLTLATDNSVRSFVIEIVANYYLAALAKYKVDNIQNKLLLNKSFLNIAKLKRKDKNDILYLETEVLNTQRDLSIQKFRLKKAYMDLNRAMFVPWGNRYKLTSNLEYKPLKVTPEYLFKAIEKSIDMQQTNIAYDIAKLNLKNASLARLPVPSIFMSGANLSYSKSEDSLGKSFSFNGRKAGNFDLRVGISWSIPIWGAGGFFGQTTFQKAKLEVVKAKYNRESVRKDLELDMFIALEEIKAQTEQIDITKMSLKNSSEILDGVIKKYRSGNVDRESLTEAVDNLINTNEVYLNYLLSYYLLKVGIARRINDDRLLGELNINDEGISQ